ncbi:MAG: amidohydrolase family protein [Candidatus Methanomethylicia archaeon]
MIYIDAHTHFGPPGKDLPPVTPEERIKLMDDIGMTAMITTPPYSSISVDRSYSEANLFLLDVQRKYPERFYCVARVNPHLRVKAIEEAEWALKNGFWGIKIHLRNEAVSPDNRELIFPIMDKLKEYGGLLLLHTGEADYSHPTAVGYLAEHFPEIPIILGHLGKSFYMDAILIARWFDNVYVDTALCHSISAIEKAVELAGPEKVLYASDFPQGCIELETLKVKLADLSDRDRELILGLNAKRILDDIKKRRGL